QSAGGERLEALPEIGPQVISVPATERDRILAAYAAQGSVERVTPAIKLSQAGVPDDPGYAQQWALPQIGWDELYGNVSVRGSATIAVLDAGIDAQHPDLVGRTSSGFSSLEGATTGDSYA